MVSASFPVNTLCVSVAERCSGEGGTLCEAERYKAAVRGVRRLTDGPSAPNALLYA